MTLVLFRADSDARIGLGHIQRSLVLAVALRKIGMESLFLTNGSEDSNRERIARFGFHMDSLTNTKSWTEGDFKVTRETAKRLGCTVAMVDSHEVRDDYLAELRKSGMFVAVRDDLALFPFSSQLVVNGNADACQLPYRSSTGDTIFLLGTEYMVVKNEFMETPSRSVTGKVQNVLVIIGGTDNYNLMPRILGMLDGLPGDFNVTAVVGPFFHNTAALKIVAENSNRLIRLIYDPKSVEDLVMKADLAVSAAGQTLYELACSRCPTVAFSVAPNQQGQLLALEEAGALMSVGDADTENVILDLRRGLETCLSNAQARADMATVGQKLVDGLGAQRVARVIMNEAYRLSPTGIQSDLDNV